ncbi:hypothetical protein CLV83_2447 [Marinobacterium mangrovicola]|uniref:Uncharacterized protein n=1 Tax=Marinobacterium mangrovicola TaxID=1476959 RepID=A0A4V2PE39_9GAMM|nr:hypothetical protein CLV83_2447 [Marinobacterium mangrovicola]
MGKPLFAPYPTWVEKGFQSRGQILLSLNNINQTFEQLQALQNRYPYRKFIQRLR